MEGFLNQKPNLERYIQDASQVFSIGDLPLNQSNIHIAFKELQKSYKQYIRSWWEVKSLDTYLQQRLVYRGLRINLSPNAHQNDTEFIRGWNHLLTESSLKLIEYLLDWEKKYFVANSERLEKDITEIQIFRAVPDFITLEQRLQRDIENFQVEIKERKHRKYIRDKKDFETGQIYNTKSSYRPNTFPKSQVDLSESDISGTDDQYNSTTERFPTRKTKSKRSYSANSLPYNKRPNYNKGGRNQQPPPPPQSQSTHRDTYYQAAPQRETCYQTIPHYSGGQSSVNSSSLTGQPQFFQNVIHPGSNGGMGMGPPIPNIGSTMMMGQGSVPPSRILGGIGSTTAIMPSPFLGLTHLPPRERD